MICFRAGVIPYTIVNNDIIFLMGIDNKTREYTDFGGCSMFIKMLVKMYTYVYFYEHLQYRYSFALLGDTWCNLSGLTSLCCSLFLIRRVIWEVYIFARSWEKGAF